MATSLSDLRTNAKVLADMVDTSFVTDAQWNVFINYAYRKLYDILVRKFEGYFESAKTYTGDGSTTDFTLPDNFYKVLDVDFELDGQSGKFGTVLPYSNIDRNWRANSNSTSSLYGTRPRYKLRGNKLRMLPAPKSNKTVRIKYVPIVEKLVNDLDEVTLQLMTHWSEYIEVDAAIRALEKEETDSIPLVRHRSGLEKRIEDSALQRDVHMPLTISDVENLAYDDWVY